MVRNFIGPVPPQIFNFQDFRKIGISMYLKWPSKPAVLSRVYTGHLYYLFLDISQPGFPKTFHKNKNRKSEIRRGGNRNGGGEGTKKKKIYEFQIQIFRFPDFIFPVFIFFCKYLRGNMLVRYRGINNKGVLERPGTKWKVLKAISNTLKFQECQKS